MNETVPTENGGSEEAQPGPTERVLLCVVDDSEELSVALEFAALRARRTGSRVALLYVMDPSNEFRHWASVGDLMREEARAEAEQVLQRAGAQIHRWSDLPAIYYIREGARTDEVIKLIEETPEVRVLILGANVGPSGPGPLVTSLTGKMIGRLRTPVMIVPGNLSDEELEALS